MSEETNRERMLAKIRKLLSLGRDARGNEHETQAALRQAAKLMEELGISEAEADMSALDRDEMQFGETTIRPDGQDASYDKKPMKECPSWAGVLAVGVGKFCNSYARRTTRAHGQVLVFQGEKNDVLFAKWLFSVLVDAINKACDESWCKTRGDRGAFRNGAASRLSGRLHTLADERRNAFKKAQQLSGNRALVVVDRKEAEIKQRFGVVKYSNSNYRGDDYARHAGVKAGDKINIPQGRPIGQGEKHKQIG